MNRDELVEQKKEALKKDIQEWMQENGIPAAGEHLVFTIKIGGRNKQRPLLVEAKRTITYSIVRDTLTDKEWIQVFAIDMGPKQRAFLRLLYKSEGQKMHHSQLQKAGFNSRNFLRDVGMTMKKAGFPLAVVQPPGQDRQHETDRFTKLCVVESPGLPSNWSI